jgi:hypothetical protein
LDKTRKSFGSVYVRWAKHVAKIEAFLSLGTTNNKNKIFVVRREKRAKAFLVVGQTE